MPELGFVEAKPKSVIEPNGGPNFFGYLKLESGVEVLYEDDANTEIIGFIQHADARFEN